MENFNKENNAPEVGNPDQKVVGADGVKQDVAEQYVVEQDVAKQDLVFFYFGMFGICLTSLVFSQLAPVINTFMEAHLLPKIAGVMESVIDFFICVFTLVKMLAYSKPSSDVFKRCLLVACGSFFIILNYCLLVSGIFNPMMNLLFFITSGFLSKNRNYRRKPYINL